MCSLLHEVYTNDSKQRLISLTLTSKYVESYAVTKLLNICMDMFLHIQTMFYHDLALCVLTDQRVIKNQQNK